MTDVISKSRPEISRLICGVLGLAIVLQVNGYANFNAIFEEDEYNEARANFIYEIKTACPKEYGVRIRFQLGQNGQVSGYFSYHASDRSESYELPLADLPPTCRDVTARFSKSKYQTLRYGNHIAGRYLDSLVTPYKVVFSDDSLSSLNKIDFTAPSISKSLGEYEALFTGRIIRVAGGTASVTISIPRSMKFVQSIPEFKTSKNIWLQNDYTFDLNEPWHQRGSYLFSAADSEKMALKDFFMILAGFLVALGLESAFRLVFKR